MFELTKQFYFDSAHTLARAPSEPLAEGSRRVHGHSYRAEIAIRGKADPQTGMVVDFAVLDRAIDKIRDQLDHRLLDEVPGLGAASVENLCVWIWQKLVDEWPGLARVAIYRDSTRDGCIYRGEV